MKNGLRALDGRDVPFRHSARRQKALDPGLYLGDAPSAGQSDHPCI